MNNNPIAPLVIEALEDLKGQSIISYDVSHLTTITSTMVFCTGTSQRHVKSLADKVVLKAKAMEYPPLSVEGTREGEWVLVDLGEVIVHVMLDEIRKFYQLEKIWDPSLVKLPPIN